jgi:hypothetical protein
MATRAHPVFRFMLDDLVVYTTKEVPEILRLRLKRVLKDVAGQGAIGALVPLPKAVYDTFNLVKTFFAEGGFLRQLPLNIVTFVDETGCMGKSDWRFTAKWQVENLCKEELQRHA